MLKILQFFTMLSIMLVFLEMRDANTKRDIIVSHLNAIEDNTAKTCQ